MCDIPGLYHANALPIITTEKVCPHSPRLKIRLAALVSPLFLLFLFYLVPVHAFAQDCQPEIKLAQTDYQSQIYTPLHYIYTITYPTHCRMEPVLVNHHAMQCQVHHVQTTQNTSLSETSVDVLCQYHKYGYFYTSPVYFRLSDSQTSQTIRFYPDSAETFIQNKSVESMPQNFGIIQWKQRPVLTWTILIISLILLISAGLFAAHIRRKKQILQNIPKPPVEIFMSEIDKLEKRTPDSIESYQLFYDALSAALRQYIRDMVHIDALKLTTKQLIQNLPETHIHQKDIDEINRILTASDSVKFSRKRPDGKEHRSMINDARILAQNILSSTSDEALSQSNTIQE